jgi:23S rRNA (adenine2503-C2)-methyltransferase
LNVIPFNPVQGLSYRTPSASAQKAFRRILEDAGVAVRFRHRKGDKIDAACGQLRRRTAREKGRGAVRGEDARPGQLQ